MIRTDHITYAYPKRDDEGNVIGATVAISDVSFTVKKGEFIAILGHNGSGKSTLAKQLNAILVPSEGSVYVDGYDTKDMSKLWDIRQRVGMVFQNPDNQIVAGIVEEDVGFGPENLGVPTEEILERVHDSLKAVDMLEFKDAPPGRLSGGQKQRVAIAGVLAMKSRCLVLDEPTAMLDPIGRKEVLWAAKKMNQEEDVTVILITHYMEEVTEADRVIVMDHGQIVMQGTPKEIFSRVEELESYQLDVPVVTRLAFDLKGHGVNLSDGIIRRDELVEQIMTASLSES